MVKWFLVQIIKITGPLGQEQYSTTLDRVDFEPWVITDENGVEQTVQLPKPRYGCQRSYAYNEEKPPYTVALVRAEMTEDCPFEILDIVQELDTPEKFATTYASYPNLVGRFIDQPV